MIYGFGAAAAAETFVVVFVVKQTIERRSGCSRLTFYVMLLLRDSQWSSERTKGRSLIIVAYCRRNVARQERERDAFHK